MTVRSALIGAVCFFMTISVRAQQSQVVLDYIKHYRNIAIAEMHRTGVPAAIKLAQGIHESMAGQSDLVQKSNNHFGVKCKSDYTGPYVVHDDDRPREHFMKYDNPEQSYIDQSNFLKGKERYSFLFNLDPTDYKSWALGLKKAGYATDPRYPQLLINIIEKYNLADYTAMGLGTMPLPADMAAAVPAAVKANFYPAADFKINDTRVVFIKKGSNLYDVARQYNIPLNQLFDFNDFKTLTTILPKDQLVYLQLKRTSGANAFHEVKAGETIFDIAQEEGIRLESLLKYNRITKFDSPAIGSRLILQENNTGMALN